MKKRKRLFLIILILVLLIPSFGIAYKGYKTVTLKVDGNEVKSDVPPIVLDGRTLVPARYLAEELGAKVEWDGKNNIVNVKSISSNPDMKKLKKADNFYEKATFMFAVYEIYALSDNLNSIFWTTSNDLIKFPDIDSDNKGYYKRYERALDLAFSNRAYLENNIKNKMKDIKNSENEIKSYYDDEHSFKEDFKYVNYMEEHLELISKEFDLLELVYANFKDKNIESGAKYYDEFQVMYDKNEDIHLKVAWKHQTISIIAFEYQNAARDIMYNIIY